MHRLLDLIWTQLAPLDPARAKPQHGNAEGCPEQASGFFAAFLAHPAALLGRDAVLSSEPEIERLASNLGSEVMKFVLVNDKAPRLSTTCAHCRAPIETHYLRDLSSKAPYCGYACYLAWKKNAPVVWYMAEGIDGLLIPGL